MEGGNRGRQSHRATAAARDDVPCGPHGKVMTVSARLRPLVWTDVATGIAGRNMRRVETIADTWRAMAQHTIKMSERAAA